MAADGVAHPSDDEGEDVSVTMDAGECVFSSLSIGVRPRWLEARETSGSGVLAIEYRCRSLGCKC